jgi:hypothetical protein
MNVALVTGIQDEVELSSQPFTSKHRSIARGANGQMKDRYHPV